jgi:hypothetical protein
MKATGSADINAGRTCRSCRQHFNPYDTISSFMILPNVIQETSFRKYYWKLLVFAKHAECVD